MASNILSLDSYDTLFADFIQSKLNLQANQVLISYPVKGQKSSVINEDVCYVHTENVDNEISILKNRREKYNLTTGKNDVQQASIRILRLHLIFYGPNSDILATKLNEYMYFESSKQFLNDNNLNLIPASTTLSDKIHEKINERWWDRNDLDLYFYNEIHVDESLDIFVSSNIVTHNNLED